MKIDAKFFGAIIFLIAQTSGAIWWASSLSAEVGRLAGIQGQAIPELQAEAKQCGIEIHNLKKVVEDQDAIQEAIKGLDVLKFQVQQISSELEQIRETNRDIANQHGQLFDALRSAGPPQGPAQQKGGYGGYSYD
tara:strand:+ start:630 stop:1034 length:405 start_codon:yes stop_codon:yes gene_type:complete